MFDVELGPVPELVPIVRHGDERGFFEEIYQKSRHGWDIAQINHSFSHKGTIRGLHWQVAPEDIFKYVKVISGTIEDVVVDLRQSSKTFGMWHSYLLSDNREEESALFVPAGFAHGFGVLSEKAHVVYCQDKKYSPEHARSLYYADPVLAIKWEVKNLVEDKVIISAQDKAAPTLSELNHADLFT
jgi:dTDP-4-dehydrorhamnose 3,5-epimerase